LVKPARPFETQNTFGGKQIPNLELESLWNRSGKSTSLSSTEPRKNDPFVGEVALAVDTENEHQFILTQPYLSQDIDAIRGRGLNRGGGVVGEGGETRPGVIGVAGLVVPFTVDQFGEKLKDEITEATRPGRGLRAGVVGIGAALSDPPPGSTSIGGAVGVQGVSDTNDGVVGLCAGNGKSGVFGFNSEKRGSRFWGVWTV
jgi:hypothetical protein